MVRRVLVLVSLLVLVAACSGGGDGAAPTTVPSSAVPTTVPTTVPGSTTSVLSTTSTTTPSTTTPSTTTRPVTTTTTATTTTAVPTTTVPTATVDVKLYLLRGERLVIVHRAVAGPAVLRGALTALLEGPTAAERAAGLTSTIPVGTTLRNVTIAGGLATVDLGAAFGTGGGSLSMFARVAEVVFTATQFSTVDRVTFRLDGRPITELGGEGLVVDPPVTRAWVPRSFTGGVLVDTPVPGATVGRTFTVTGEGDVYEAQFPIEVWAGDRMIGGVAPVTAGAWGIWGRFSVTVTVAADAAPGPIELRTYDAGGCGFDPECGPVIMTIVPLTLAP